MRILSNIPALQSYNALTSTNASLQKSINRLSTGLRINSAADDAAGLAISEKMRAQIRGLDQATSNAQDGISMIQTAEGALNETHSILQRMRELSVQASNDTLTQQDRGYIQLEVDQLKEEVTRISNTTQFNKKKLLDGSAAVLWSSDNLKTKAVVNGGLRQVDQFGQKAAVEGNFKISINADPGQAEIQKTDIFKIKHKNVIMNVSLDQNNGFQSVSVDNLPAGTYSITQAAVNTANTAGPYRFAAGAGLAGYAAFTAIGGSIVVASGGVISGATAINVVITIGADTSLASAADANGRAAGAFYNGTFYSAGTTLNATINVIGPGGITASITSGGSITAAAAAELSAFVINNFARVSATLPSDLGGVSYNAFYGLDKSNLNVDVKKMSGIKNASVLLEVIKVDTAAGSVTFRAQVSEMDVFGKTTTRVDDNLVVTTAGVSNNYNKLGMLFKTAGAMTIANISSYDVGDKMVLNFMADATTAVAKSELNTIAVNGQLNTDWPGAWLNGTAGATVNASYNVAMTALANQTVHFKSFYLNTANGTVHQGDIVIGFNTAVSNMVTGSGTATRVSFEAAFVGQVAKGDVKLRDLDKFWDANGRFMLEDSQQLTIYQGDGNKTQITLNSTDTLDDVRKKLNDAIAYDLGQAQYVSSAANNFVSFIETPEAGTPDAVAGTFVIRSLIPGREGRLNFSGDEDVIKALSLNVIQDARESTFNVSVEDAHSGNTVATNVKVTGSTMRGVINPNVDVQFDSMANIEATWNESTKSFDLRRASGTYETILHLADNTTVFQIGANEGEDMGIDMGDMSARSLGVDRVLVTDRESAARSITIIDSAIDKVSNQRAKLGAYQNRLEHTINNLTTASTNTTASESRIRDVDMAKEMMNFTKLNILSQAGTSMLAQANQLPQNVLSLLR